MSELQSLLNQLQNMLPKSKGKDTYPKFYQVDIDGESMSFIVMEKDTNPVFVLTDSTNTYKFGDTLKLDFSIIHTSICTEISEKTAIGNISPSVVQTYVEEELPDLIEKTNKAIDWTDSSEKYTVVFDHEVGEFKISVTKHKQVLGAPYTTSRKQAEQALTRAISETSSHTTH
jgi:hypothetical protein